MCLKGHKMFLKGRIDKSNLWILIEAINLTDKFKGFNDEKVVDLL